MGAERAASEPETGFAPATETGTDWLGTSEIHNEMAIEAAPPRSGCTASP